MTTQELEDRYPDLSPKEQEDAITRELGAVFLMQIGGVLKSGQKHDGRAPDYDDWSLNGDILLYYPVLDRAFEVSSMGIRVDAPTLKNSWLLPAARAGRKAGVSSGASEGGTAFDGGRRNRPVPALHVSAGQGAHRRGAGFRFGRRRCCASATSTILICCSQTARVLAFALPRNGCFEM